MSDLLSRFRLLQKHLKKDHNIVVKDTNIKENMDGEVIEISYTITTHVTVGGQKPFKNKPLFHFETFLLKANNEADTMERMNADAESIEISVIHWCRYHINKTILEHSIY